MTNLLSPLLKQKFFDNNGKPAAGYQLFSYEAGTSIKRPTYKSNVESVPNQNANPTILDFRGEANVWTPPNVSYKFVLAPPTDTDPPTAPVLTVDNVVDAQLITLYGGVDTGSVNAYVLNFVANFAAYQDGIVIYWIPSNTNTGASTINVNGLGPVAVLNQDGTTLTAGQVVANQISTIMYKGTGFRLVGATATTTSLWGGTSTGVANTYVLAATQVSAYYEGLIIYWIPNVTNTGATTINVNALGAKTIANQDGTALTGGEVVAAQIMQMVYTGGLFKLINTAQANGSFAAILTGMSSGGTGTINYEKRGSLITLHVFSQIIGVSNTTACTVGTLPAVLRPGHDVYLPCMVCNSSNVNCPGAVQISAGSGTMTLLLFNSSVTNIYSTTGFANAGNKGLPAGWTITYTTG